MPFLTKSRYRLGCECPTKIHYSANRAYHNKKSDDAFLLALAADGSNSLKAVLPAILSSSPFLKEKYSRPVYGTQEMRATYFSNFVCLPPGTTDPYKLLTPMENTSGDEDSADPDGVTNGGEAMIAYAKCQFTDISDAEVNAIRKDLLKYCELDTLAMVMLWETWMHDEVPGAGLFGNR